MTTNEQKPCLTQRRGKFTYEVDAIAYGLSLCGADDEVGDVEVAGGHSALLRSYKVDGPFSDLTPEARASLSEFDVAFLRKHEEGCIISTDSDGFVTVEWFTTADEREHAWARRRSYHEEVESYAKDSEA